MKFKEKGSAVLAGLLYAQGILGMLAIGTALERQFDFQIPGDGYGVEVVASANPTIHTR